MIPAINGCSLSRSRSDDLIAFISFPVILTRECAGL